MRNKLSTEEKGSQKKKKIRFVMMIFAESPQAGRPAVFRGRVYPEEKVELRIRPDAKPWHAKPAQQECTSCRTLKTTATGTSIVGVCLQREKSKAVSLFTGVARGRGGLRGPRLVACCSDPFLLFISPHLPPLYSPSPFPALPTPLPKTRQRQPKYDLSHSFNRAFIFSHRRHHEVPRCPRLPRLPRFCPRLRTSLAFTRSISDRALKSRFFFPP
jgi:hypothetical protein